MLRRRPDALTVNYQTIGYLERGEYNPSLDLALRIAEHFGLRNVWRATRVSR